MNDMLAGQGTLGKTELAGDAAKKEAERANPQAAVEKARFASFAAKLVAALAVVGGALFGWSRRSAG